MSSARLDLCTVFRTLGLSLAVFAASGLPAQDRLRILEPPSLTGNGSGWALNPGTGGLSLTLSMGSLPGEIPIPATFRMNATSSMLGRTIKAKAWVDPTTGRKPPTLYRDAEGVWCGKDADGNPVDVVYQNTTFYYWKNYPMEGDVSFGGFNGGNNDVLLENGTWISGADWVSGKLSPATFTAPSAFGLGAVPAGTTVWSSLDGNLAQYSLPALPAALSAHIIAPIGYPGGANYRVVMDHNLARIYSPFQGNAWRPLLFVDRFGHWVSFAWEKRASGLPSTLSAIESVSVTNQRDVGFLLQWASPAAGAVLDWNARLDYIGIPAPSFLLKGLPGCATPFNPAFAAPYDDGHDTANSVASILGPSLRVQEYWMGLQSQLPHATWEPYAKILPSAIDAPAAPVAKWQCAYDALGTELQSITSPTQVTTVFTYANDRIYRPTDSPGTAAFSRGVIKAESTDATTGVKKITTLTRKLPSRSPSDPVTVWSSVPWSAELREHFVAPGGSDPTDEVYASYTFAPANATRDYSNGSLLGFSLYTPSHTYSPLKSRTSSYTGGGYDGSLSLVSATSDTVLDGTSIYGTYTYDKSGVLPRLASILKAGGLIREKTEFASEFHPEDLDPERTTAVTTSRSTSVDGNNWTPLPEQKVERTTYDPATSLVSSRFVDGGTLGTQGVSYSQFDQGRPTLIRSLASQASMGHSQQSLTYTNGGLDVVVSTQTQATPVTTLVTQSASRDAAWRTTSSKDIRGVKTVTQYDIRGRVTRVAVEGQPEIVTAYPDEYTRTTTANGLTSTETYDGFGRLMSRVSPGGKTPSSSIRQELTYDAFGRVASRKETAGSKTRVTSWTYDVLGRPLTEIRPDGTSTHYTYAANQRTIAIFPSGGGTALTSTEWLNGLGEVQKTRSPGGTLTTLIRDGLGRVTGAVTTEPGLTSQSRSWTFDGLGRLIGRQAPETGIQTFGSFTAQGLPQTLTEGSGTRVRTFGYDALGRATSVTVGGVVVMSRAFTGADLTQAIRTSGSGTVTQTYTYDPGPGRRLKSLQTQQADLDATVTYGYDANGWITTLSYPSGRTIQYTHDILGRTTKVENLYGNSIVNLVNYDDWGNQTDINFRSGAVNQKAYDPTGLRLSSWSLGYPGGTTESLAYGYDAYGRLSQSGGWSCTYDSDGRLTETDGFGLNIAHLHDGFGNAIRHAVTATTGTVPQAMVQFEFYPMANNQVPGVLKGSSGTTGWLMNERGEATNIGTQISSSVMTLAWNDLGQLATASVNGNRQDYLYSPDGLRVKTTDSLTSNSRTYVYGAGGELLGEYTGGGGWKRDVVYLGSLAVAEVDAVGVHELHSDQLGTPRVITSGASGQVEARQGFGPYGDPMPALCSGNYSPLTGYTGHLQTDLNTGLIYMKGRFYSPRWHRFLNSDQGVDSNQANQFAYCAGSPLMATDPSGLVQTRGDNPRGTRLADADTSCGYASWGGGFCAPEWVMGTQVTFDTVHGSQDAIAYADSSGRFETANSPAPKFIRGIDANGNRYVFKWVQGGDFLETFIDNIYMLVRGQELGGGWTVTIDLSQTDSSSGMSWGTFTFGGLEADVAAGGAFQGVIHEHDSKHGNSVGALTEGWVGGEGGAAGVGKITSTSDKSLLSGGFIFGGGSLSAGPLAGTQVGIVVGWGWIGVYYEGHGGPAAGGQGAYINLWGGH